MWDYQKGIKINLCSFWSFLKKAVALTEGLDKQIEALKLLDANRTRVHKSKKSLSNPKSVTEVSGSSTNQSWCKDLAGNLT